MPNQTGSVITELPAGRCCILWSQSTGEGLIKAERGGLTRVEAAMRHRQELGNPLLGAVLQAAVALLRILSAAINRGAIYRTMSWEFNR